MRAFELYRYTNPDGTAKEWAYSDLGHGQAEVRWGSTNALTRSQFKPLPVAVERAREKVRKGYQHLGTVTLNMYGFRPLTERDPVATPRPGPASASRPSNPAVDLRVLLGTEDDGFYF